MVSLLVRSTLALALLAPNAVLAQETTAETATPEVAATTQAEIATETSSETTSEATAPVESSESLQTDAVNTDATAETGAASATGSVAGNSGLVAAPPADKGQIVFFRPAKFAGGAVGFKVREGDAELGKLRSGKYFVHTTEPGTREYTVHSEAKDVLTLEVEAGETYYVQGTITMGFMVGRPNLSPSDAATFDGMSSKLKLAE